MTRSALKNRTIVATGTALVLALALAGCGSSDDSGTAPASTSGATQDILGTPKAATGEPITFGLSSTGVSPALDNTTEIEAAQATVKYVNDYLGGINGRPLKLDVCADKGTPAGASDCAQQWVSAKLPAVITAASGQTNTIVKIADENHQASFINLAADANVLASPNAFIFGNPLAPFGSAAAFARQKGIKKAAVMVVDVPAASGPAKQLEPLFFANAGVSATVYGIPPGTPDATSYVQTAVNAGAQQFHLIGDPTYCATVLKAIKTLGLKQPVTGYDRCLSPEAAKSIPGGFAGLTAMSQQNYSPQDKEFQLFDAVLKKYGDGLKVTTTTASGYLAVLNTVRALNAAQVTDYTSAGLIAAARRMPETPLALGGGATMKCDGTRIPFSKAICSDFTVVGDAQADGSVTNYRTIDSTGIYTLPKS